MTKNKRFYLFRQSLLFRYLLIIMVALLFLPIIFPMSYILYNLVNELVVGKPTSTLTAEAGLYNNGQKLEQMWHTEALHLKDASPEEVNERLRQLSESYSRALMFWVNGVGELEHVFSPLDTATVEDAMDEAHIPAQWTATESIAFMKASTDSNPFTVVAFVGDKAELGQGFMVMQIPRSLIKAVSSPAPVIIYGTVLLVLFLGFAVVSWLFFDRIRRRLLRLQTAMTRAEKDGFPGLIQKGKTDEIGKLEEAFNTMVIELKDSRRRELDEEQLRKRLISDLSHDLRTPLTVIRSHVYNLGKEKLSEEGARSLILMDERIADLSVLMDNLLSYNLLTSGRITLKLERKDILRLLRESAAAWYPLWEREGFSVEIELDEESLYWQVDEIWFRRVLDNLYQNIMRHAHGGLYVGLSTQIRNGVHAIVISDHGSGMNSDSNTKGAGLGLSIVDLLLSRMNLKWEVKSSSTGTSIVIYSSALTNI
ncbi:sensor histidine kinase [Paenibacillus wynnii]|uniref:sensor histidine kinase n=1 Tax=Paenibacillus wynnii TaxID=268407 RepID=UPI002791EB93|nr:HAMP domain-containing sensor histidine kinase [Paenibacillus wynnii]MDQ0196179.1 signal transduction histidine kinase [Paenibacillus wynnii]